MADEQEQKQEKTAERKYTAWRLPTVNSNLTTTYGQQKKISPEDLLRHDRMLQESILQVKKIGYADGYEVGKKEGVLAGTQEFTTKIKDLEQLIDSFKGNVLALTNVFEGQILSIIKKAVRAVVKHEAKLSDDSLLQIIKEALAILPRDPGTITVHINPNNLKLLEKAVADELFHSFTELKFSPNEDVSKGGCVIETKTSLVDASLEKRLENMLEQFSDKSEENDATDN